MNMFAGRLLRPLSLCRQSVRRLPNRVDSVKPSVALCRFMSEESADKTSRGTTGIPRYQVQPIDRFWIKFTRTMKGDIPDEVSYDLIEKAQNRRRIFINLLFIVLTGMGGLYGIRRGRQVAKDKSEPTLFQRNVNRYEKLREEDREKQSKLEAKAEVAK